MRTRRRRGPLAHAHWVGLPGPPDEPALTGPPTRLPSVLPSARPVVALVGLATGLVLIVAAAAVLGGSSPRLTGDASAASSPTAAASVLPASPAAAIASPVLTTAPSEPATAGLAGYHWPLDHGRITAAFGPLTGGVVLADGVPYHDGVDIASFCGDRIVAAHDGVVLAAGRHVDRYLGWDGDIAAYHARLDATGLWGSRAIIVIIDDGNGFRSVYVHLERATVEIGQGVHAGDLIGYEGQTGYATGCHLHYSIFDPEDPGRFQTLPRLVKSEHLPAQEVARIDPLAILPPMSTTSVTWGWGAGPSPSP